jgi:hypothetical protein
MTVYYLIFAILLTSGVPAQTITHPFPTLEACEAAGNAASVDIVKNDQVRQAVWKCDAIDFDKADPAPAPRHVPGGREA